MFKRKKSAIFATVLLFVVLAAGTGLGVAYYISSLNQGTNHAVVENPPPAPNIGVELPVQVTLDGEWSAENNGSQFMAVVVDNAITIKFVNGDTSMIYWNGTFQTSAALGATVNSTKIEIDKMVLSGAESKDFVVEADALSFEFEAMGVTKKVVLTRA